MKYEAIRQDIKSGDLLVWQTQGFTGWLIRTMTGESYSHVGVAWVVGERVFVLEAQTPKVRQYALSEELPCYLLSTGATWTHEAETFALSQLGKSYSYLDDITAWIGMVLKRTFKRSGDGWQCVEYAKSILNLCGMKLTSRPIPGELVSEILSLDGTSLRSIEP